MMKLKIKVKLVDDGTILYENEYVYEYNLELLDRIALSDLLEYY